jgi:hypothetical protein
MFLAKYSGLQSFSTWEKGGAGGGWGRLPALLHVTRLVHELVHAVPVSTTLVDPEL